MGSLRRWLTLAILGVFSVAGASADALDDIRANLQDALNRNDTVAALHISQTLYDAAMVVDDDASAGAAAYTRGELLLIFDDEAEAAVAYELCQQHYRSIGAAAQKLQCAYKAGAAYSSSGRPGKGLDILQSAARELEDLGQERSSLAANVYLSLAKATMPSKLERIGRGTGAKRRNAIRYAERAMEAFEATGHKNSEMYASALYLKAETLEQMKDFAEAAIVYEAFIDLYETLPNHSEDVLFNATTRYDIVSGASDRSENDEFSVVTKDGREIILEIKNRRAVRFPRIDGNKLVDGASVQAEVTLGADGRPETIEILLSHPDDAFGEAFEDAVKHWRFTPPEGISPEDIPPFEYGLVFSIERR